MATLIRNMPSEDVQWSKFKHGYMWNKVYHLRRTKFALYQLATTFVGVGHALSDVTLKHYNDLPKKDIPGFPDARFNTTDIVVTSALNIASCSIVGMVFTWALLFDLFWPERVEARSIQLCWKWSAAFASIIQLAGPLAATIIVGTHRAGITGASLAQESDILDSWSGTQLVYRQYVVAVVSIVISWLGWVFTFGSTIVMWKSYAHNNKYGPFAKQSMDTLDTALNTGTNISRV